MYNKIKIHTIWCHLNQRTINADENKKSFEGENTQTQYSVIGYRIDLYYHDYKLAI